MAISEQLSLWDEGETPLERTKAVIHELLGDVTELPLMFEQRMLCPRCLVRALMVCGGHMYCPACSASYRGTIVLTKQGRHYLRLNDI